MKPVAMNVTRSLNPSCLVTVVMENHKSLLRMGLTDFSEV